MTGWHHAPPPGSRSGVADYAETLRRALAGFGPAGIDLYHLGNNSLHAGIYQMALEQPGVIVLHDAVLHHFLLGQLSRPEYVEEFVFNYGEWQRDLAEELWAARGSSGVDPRYFQFPLLKRIVSGGRAVIVHNPGAARIARAHAPASMRIHVIPHVFEPAADPDHAEVAKFRAGLGVGPGTTLFGIFGYLRETKRVLPCLRAFRRLHAARPDTALLLAGDAVSGDLRRLLATEALHPHIHRLGHLSERDLLLAASATDCCLNLRYPAAGETSGIATRLMGMGKPVIMTAGPENEALPAAGCLRVAQGIAESRELFDCMALVTEFPQTAKDIGREGRRHILAHHSPEAVARQYRQVLYESAAGQDARMPGRIDFYPPGAVR